MNEHIKLLKEQAMEWVPNMADPDTKIRLLNAGKFAELIVRECMSIVENYPIDPEDMPYNGRIIPYMIFVQEKMQLHFGVEE
jgi:hypothetical protein